MKRTICVILLVCLFLCGCKKEVCKAQVQQPLENVVSIELLNPKKNKELVVLYTLDPSEHDAFLDEFMEISFQANGTPPTTQYGQLAVRLTYQDGYCDIIGLTANWYLDSNGEKVGGHYWYGVVDEGDYYNLFSKYVSEDLLPPEMNN